MKHKIKNLKPKFIKLIISILILMLIFSQIENGLTLNVVFATQQSFEADNATFYYDPDSNENCIYFYNGDKSKMIRCPLQTYNGKDVYYPEGYQEGNLLTIYTKDEKTGKYTKSGEYTIDQAYTYMDVETGTLASFLGTGITPETVNKKLGITDSDKKAKTGKETDKEDDVTDTSKIANDYAKYSYDKDSDTLSVKYYDPNTNKIVTRTYSFNKNSNQFEMNNNDHNQAYYSDFVNNDEHNKAHKVQTAIDVKDFENVTGISASELDDYIKNGNDSDDDSYFENFVNGVAGFFLYPLKILPLLFGKILQAIMGIFTENDGTLSVEDILFNRLDITKIDFFNLSTGNEIVDTIRKSVAEWYYGLRNISAVVLFAILIYLGLRMALSTVAEEKARYSQTIVNWVESIALLFVLHYLIAIIMSLNNQLVAIISKNFENVDPIDKIFVNAWKVGFVEGFGNAICYLILVGMTFVFLLAYLKRMITIGFLIVIAPLVTITYSVDKIGDNKSQALNTWFKEFIYNILIQPFQCVSYIILASSAMKILDDEASLKAMIIAIMMILFVYQSEKIIRHIFHFEARTMSETVSHAALVGTTLGMVTNASGKKIDTSDDAIKDKNKKNNKTFTNMQNNVNNANMDVQNVANNQSKVAKSNPHRRNGRVRNAISAVTNNKFAQNYMNMASTGSKLLLGGSLALSTGSTSTFLNTGNKILKNGAQSGQDYIEERNKHQLQQAYSEAVETEKENMINNLAKQAMNIDNIDNLSESQQQLFQRVKEQIENTEGDNITEQAKDYVALRAREIANGKEATTLSEQKVKESIEQLRETYTNNGMNEKYADAQISEDIADIRKGKYTESTHLGVVANQKIDNFKETGEIAKETGKIIATPVTAAKRRVKRYYKKNNS